MIKFLKKIDIEFYLILFLLSGMFKNLLFSIYDNNIKIPLTIIFGILLILIIYIKDIYNLKRLKEEYKSFIFLLISIGPLNSSSILSKIAEDIGLSK